MSPIDIFSIVGTVVTICGGLDIAVKKQHKLSLSNWVTRASGKKSGFGYKGSIFLDKIFGKRLFSIRAIASYAGCSLASIVASYAIAVWTSAPDMWKSISVFPNKVTSLDIFLLLLAIALAVAGDIASYAQTRVFVRAVDQYKNPVVMIGLILADIVTSFSLLFLAFTIARTVLYIFVIQSNPTLSLEKHTQYITEIPKLLFANNPAFGDDSPNRGNLALAHALASVKSNDKTSPADLAMAAKVVDLQKEKSANFNRFVEYSAKTDTVNYKSNVFYYIIAWGNTELLLNQLKKDVGQGTAPIADTSKARMQAEVIVLEKAAAKPNVSMDIDSATVARNLPLNSVIAIAGPFNVLSAAFERTLRDSYQVIGYKLSPYVSFDPYAGLSDFIGIVQTESNTSFLGRPPSKPERYEVLKYFNDPLNALPSQLQIPFSPMVASCLTSTMFFFSYLVFVVLAEIREALLKLVRRVAPAFDWNKAIFTSLGIAFCIALCVLYLADIVFSEAWTVLFS
ncbi:hypothetical protein [Paraburkholderia sediminicola]|uniref:hypothetical protein n=1 Tax=Paraburkholderia sediminicola TaxID=458836 RepID=UPI0038BD5C99